MKSKHLDIYKPKKAAMVFTPPKENKGNFPPCSPESKEVIRDLKGVTENLTMHAEAHRIEMNEYG